MSDLFWLTPSQVRRIEPYFPLSHGVPRVDDRRVISGIIFVQCMALMERLRRVFPAISGAPKGV